MTDGNAQPNERSMVLRRIRLIAAVLATTAAVFLTACGASTPDDLQESSQGSTTAAAEVSRTTAADDEVLSDSNGSATSSNPEPDDTRVTAANHESDQMATIELGGTNAFSGSAEMLCSFYPLQNMATISFFTDQQNELGFPVVQIFTIGEFNGSTGGGAVTNAAYTPGETALFAGEPTESSVRYDGSNELMRVAGTAVANDGTNIEFDGSCVPTAYED